MSDMVLDGNFGWAGTYRRRLWRRGTGVTRLRAVWIGTLVAVALLAPGTNRQARAQNGVTLLSLSRRIQRLEAKLRYISVTTEMGRPSMIITNANLSLRSSGRAYTRTGRKRAARRKATRPRRTTRRVAVNYLYNDGIHIPPLLSGRRRASAASRKKVRVAHSTLLPTHYLEIKPAPVRLAGDGR